MAAWVRKTRKSEELIVASDSRVTGGIALNHAPKIFPLQRSDAVMAYCGPTLVAYPILLQVKASLDAHDETRNRVVDIIHLKAHIEKTIERVRARIRGLPTNDDTHRSFKFLLAGYSWKLSRFKVWTFRYDIQTREFNAYSMPRNDQYIFMSDSHANELRARDELRRRVFRNPIGIRNEVDWEPLKVLISIIEDRESDDIGGPPQMVKIYRHANTLPVNVLWPEDKTEEGLNVRTYEINHLGRPLLGYEKTSLLTLDPVIWEFVEPWNVREHAKIYNDCEDFKLRQRLRARVATLLAWNRDRIALQDRLTLMLKEKRDFADISAVMRAAQENAAAAK